MGMLGSLACGEERVPKPLAQVTIQEQLGNQLNVDVPFINHQGLAVKLGDYFKAGRPVLLTLNYYACPMLCTLQLNGLIQTLRQVGWKPGDSFQMVTLSIDARETPELANQKRKSYLDLLGWGEVSWDFLVGQEENIRTVASAVGFTYQYDPETDQFAHPAVAFFLSPGGQVMRYLYGLQVSARDFKFALIDASLGKVGTTLEKLILSCYMYDSRHGAYGPFAMGMMRLGGILTVVLVAFFLALLWKREQVSDLKTKDC
jgi:protein SCO1/2